MEGVLWVEVTVAVGISQAEKRSIQSYSKRAVKKKYWVNFQVQEKIKFVKPVSK